MIHQIQTLSRRLKKCAHLGLDISANRQQLLHRQIDHRLQQVIKQPSWRTTVELVRAEIQKTGTRTAEVCHSAVSHLVFCDSDSGLQAQSPPDGRERQNHKNVK